MFGFLQKWHTEYMNEVYEHEQMMFVNSLKRLSKEEQEARLKELVRGNFNWLHVHRNPRRGI